MQQVAGFERQKKNVDSIKRAVKDGDNLLAEMLGTIGELETSETGS